MTDPSELSSTLKSITPAHFAVAYLGSAWRKYLTDIDSLKEIIAFPAIGSYQGALDELLKTANDYNFNVL